MKKPLKFLAVFLSFIVTASGLTPAGATNPSEKCSVSEENKKSREDESPSSEQSIPCSPAKRSRKSESYSEQTISQPMLCPPAEESLQSELPSSKQPTPQSPAAKEHSETSLQKSQAEQHSQQSEISSSDQPIPQPSAAKEHSETSLQKSQAEQHSQQSEISSSDQPTPQPSAAKEHPETPTQEPQSEQHTPPLEEESPEEKKRRLEEELMSYERELMSIRNKRLEPYDLSTLSWHVIERNNLYFRFVMSPQPITQRDIDRRIRTAQENMKKFKEKNFPGSSNSFISNKIKLLYIAFLLDSYCKVTKQCSHMFFNDEIVDILCIVDPEMSRIKFAENIRGNVIEANSVTIILSESLWKPVTEDFTRKAYNMSLNEYYTMRIEEDFEETPEEMYGMPIEEVVRSDLLPFKILNRLQESQIFLTFGYRDKTTGKNKMICEISIPLGEPI